MQLIAHRGGAARRMENTLAAFAHAIQRGAAGAELDVHLLADGEVVVYHDAWLNPAWCRHVDGDFLTAGEARPLAELVRADLARYDISRPRPDSAYAARHPLLEHVPGQRIPRLREVIDEVAAASATFRLVIEIKTDLLAIDQTPARALVDAVLDVLEATAFTPRAVLCSFDWRALRHAHACRPDLPLWFTTVPASWFAEGAIPEGDLKPDAAERRALAGACIEGRAPWHGGFDSRDFAGSTPRAVAAAGGAAWFPWHRDITLHHVAELHALGLECAAWTSGRLDPEETARLAAAGVDWLVED